MDWLREEIVKLLIEQANRPTGIAEMTEKHTEKPTAWIELHEDVLDEAYDMSKEIREYE